MTYYPQEDCSRINGKHYHNRHVVESGGTKILRSTATKSRYGCYYNEDNRVLFNGVFVNQQHVVTDIYGNKQHDSQCVVTAQGFVHKNDINLIYSHVLSKWMLKQHAEQTLYGWLPKAKVSLEMDIMFQTV
jgi:aerobic-type carbon monoxide dehydrogenase small subunit (CoxS/CutS family)